MVVVWYLHSDLSLVISDAAIYLTVLVTEEQNVGDIYGELMSGAAELSTCF